MGHGLSVSHAGGFGSGVSAVGASWHGDDAQRGRDAIFGLQGSANGSCPWELRRRGVDGLEASRRRNTREISGEDELGEDVRQAREPAFGDNDQQRVRIQMLPYGDRG